MKKTYLITFIIASLVIGFIFGFFCDFEKISLKIKPIKRLELKRKLDLFGRDRTTIEFIKDEDQKNHIRKLIKVTWMGLSTKAYLLVPKGCAANCPGILALHGHHTTKENIIGIDTSKFDVNFGGRLAEAGYVVLAPDIPFSKNLGLEDQLALNFIMTGTNLMGLRISYLQGLLQYLSSLPIVDSNRVGCIGWSMGGGLAMYLAAVDKRVKVVAISNYFGTYKDTCMRRRQTTDNYIPGIVNFGEMADVACLIAPRPMWIEGSSNDPEFPKEAFRKGVEGLKKCYAGNAGHFSWRLIPGGHRFKGEGIEEWFKRWL